MMSRRSSHPRPLPVLAALAAALLLAACAAPTPRPALVAKSAGGDYGYSDTKLSDSRYDMVYESPQLSVSFSRHDREQRLEAERQRAYDFALWHAAEKARELGYSALIVEQDRRNVDVNVQRERYYDPWPRYYRPYRYGPYYGYPYGYGPGYAGWASSTRGWAWARVTVSLRVHFLDDMEPGALGVEETLAGFASRYGSPTYP